MKKTNLTYLAAILVVTLSCSIQLANAQTVLTDNFSTPANWIISNSTGAGTPFNNIAVSAGTLNFTNVRCHGYGNPPNPNQPQPCDQAPGERRARRGIGTTLNENDAFRLEVDYTFLDPNPNLHLGAIPIALTAGTNDVVMNTPAGLSQQTPTNQDAVGFWFGTNIVLAPNVVCNDASRASTPVIITTFYKDNNGTAIVQTPAFTPVANVAYRLRLERKNATTFSFEVFDVANPFVAIFSSSFCLPAGTVLTGFNTVQAANRYQGNIARISNSKLDNLFIQRIPANVFNIVFFSENFDSPLTWTRNNVSTYNIPCAGGTSWNTYNNIGVFNNELHLKNIHCGNFLSSIGNGQCDGATAERPIYKSMAGTVLDDWKLNFDFSWKTSMYSAPNSPSSTATPTGSIPMCLSSGANSVLANHHGNSFQDAIGVMFLSNIVDNLSNPCASSSGTKPVPYLSIFYKDGDANPVISAEKIYIGQQGGNYYYISLE